MLQNLDLFRANPENFFSIFITGDGLWDHHHDPETNPRVYAMETQVVTYSKEFRVQQLSGKIMATVSWDSEGVLLLEFLPQEESRY